MTGGGGVDQWQEELEPTHIVHYCSMCCGLHATCIITLCQGTLATTLHHNRCWLMLLSGDANNRGVRHMY